MQIDLWSDVVCPFCYLGKKQLEQALEEFTHKDYVTVTYRSFELDQKAPIEEAMDVYDMLSAKYGISREQAIESNQRLANNAREHGLEFNMDKIQLTNSFNAHRLIHFARQHNKEKEMLERLYKAYFTEGLNIGRLDILEKLGSEVGLEKNKLDDFLATTDLSEEVRSDEQTAHQIGITGVPFFLIDNKFGVSGAQGKDNLLAALNQAWDESQDGK